MVQFFLLYGDAESQRAGWHPPAPFFEGASALQRPQSPLCMGPRTPGMALWEGRYMPVHISICCTADMPAAGTSLARSIAEGNHGAGRALLPRP